MPVTLAVPNILTDPGYVMWAPLATAEPTNTVAGSKYTDSWPVGWLNLGATDDGSKFDYTTKVEPVEVAEFFDPIRYSTVSREGSFAMALADYTLNSWKRAMNGGTLATVSGTGATLLSSYVPPTPGNEVRAMLGWESLDATLRIIVYQCINGSKIESAFKRAPDKALIPVEFQFEVPASGLPWKMYAAGTARLGT